MTSKDYRFTFSPVIASQQALVHEWLKQAYIQEWIHGAGLQNPLTGLTKFMEYYGSTLRHEA